jgi:hypothetical protein
VLNRLNTSPNTSSRMRLRPEEKVRVIRRSWVKKLSGISSPTAGRVEHDRSVGAYGVDIVPLALLAFPDDSTRLAEVAVVVDLAAKLPLDASGDLESRRWCVQWVGQVFAPFDRWMLRTA